MLENLSVFLQENFPWHKIDQFIGRIFQFTCYIVEIIFQVTGNDLLLRNLFYRLLFSQLFQLFLIFLIISHQYIIVSVQDINGTAFLCHLACCQFSPDVRLRQADQHNSQIFAGRIQDLTSHIEIFLYVVIYGHFLKNFPDAGTVGRLSSILQNLLIPLFFLIICLCPA